MDLPFCLDEFSKETSLLLGMCTGVFFLGVLARVLGLGLGFDLDLVRGFDFERLVGLLLDFDSKRLNGMSYEEEISAVKYRSCSIF